MPFHFELVSPERLLFSGEVDQVIVPGSEGEFTVLANHSPLMTTLRPGIVSVEGGGAGAQRLFVRGGFADVAPTGLTILAEMAMPVADLNGARLDAELAAARSEVEAATTEEGRRQAADRLGQLEQLRPSLGH